MGKRLNGWSLAGFLAVSVLGTLAHFCYEWSGEKLLVGAFCAVNESTWEHMKLLFFPALLFTMVQLAAARERDGALPAARAVGVTAGLALIPTLYYTYTGVWGRHAMWRTSPFSIWPPPLRSGWILASGGGSGSGRPGSRRRD